jgi:hypothetical protein
MGALQLGGEPEVGQPHRVVRHQQHIAGLEIAMHPARPVQLYQALAHLGQQLRRTGQRQLVALRQQVGE